jgi:hypothetical protein
MRIAIGSQRMLVIGAATFAPPLKRPVRSVAVAAAGATAGRAHVRSQRAACAQAGFESSRMSRMELDAPVTLRTPAVELDQLVGAQEHMRGKLLEATRDLEAKIEARTRELTRREAELRNVLDSSPIAVMTRQRKGKSVWQSPHARAVRPGRPGE